MLWGQTYRLPSRRRARRAAAPAAVRAPCRLLSPDLGRRALPRAAPHRPLPRLAPAPLPTGGRRSPPHLTPCAAPVDNCPRNAPCVRASRHRCCRCGPGPDPQSKRTTVQQQHHLVFSPRAAPLSSSAQGFGLRQSPPPPFPKHVSSAVFLPATRPPCPFSPHGMTAACKVFDRLLTW